MGSLSIIHWLILLFVVIIIFGPKKLPELAKALGESIQAFKKEMGNSNQQQNQQANRPQVQTPSQITEGTRPVETHAQNTPTHITKDN